MDQQQSGLIQKSTQPSSPLKNQQTKSVSQTKTQKSTQLSTNSKPKQQSMKNQQQKDKPIDIIEQLVQKKNPLPILAVINKINLYTKTKDGVPLFNLLMNKFLPLSDLLDECSIKFQADLDGRTPLHYAVEVDDAKAVQWLLSKNAPNVADKFGNTPVMDSVRLGHKRSFLLMLHYQHINQQLPHIGAQYNRVWQLKCMQALGLSVTSKNSQNKTPLQIAVQNYSFQAAQYLCKVTPNFQLSKLKSLTDSAAIIRRIKQTKQSISVINRCLFPILYKLFQIVLIVSLINFNIEFQGIKSLVNYGFSIVFLLEIIMWVISVLRKPKQKTPESITRLLHQPYFPNNLDHICPSCFNRYHPQLQDHCDICHTCIPKFHKHTYMCINKSNQILWYTTQFITFYILYQIKNYFNAYMQVKHPHVFENMPAIVNSFYHCFYLQQNYFVSICLLYICGLCLDKFLVCLHLFGMAFMNRTYQQTICTEKYGHLYSVFKGKNGKYRTKQNRIFLKYGLCAGIFIGLKNILLYFL